MKKGLIALGIALAESLALGLAVSQTVWLGGLIAALALWLVLPLASAVVAYRAVRRGLNNYLAWLPPPAALFAAWIIAWGYSPSAGVALLCAFTGLVGSAAGEVSNQRGK